MRVGPTLILVAMLTVTSGAQSTVERAPDGYAINMRAIHTTVMRLREAIQEKDFPGVEREASTLKFLLRNTLTFWEDRRAVHAVSRSKAAYDSAEMLLKAARAKDFSQLLRGHHALTASCVSCHGERRARLPDGSYGIR